MNDTLTSDQIAALAMEALERLAFIMADPAEDGCPPVEGEFAVVINFAGDASGTVVLRCGEGFARLLAAGLLGSEPEDVTLDPEGWDALREFANIMGGSVIRELGAESRPITLGLPENGEGGADGDAGVVSTVDAEGELIEITLITGAASNREAA